jgi:Na+-transporting methylmalonyl-CoA/oxaloacetate decarboxylase gamma subunit
MEEAMMYGMSMLAAPLAVGVIGVGLVLLIVIALAGLVYELTTRGNPRQVKVDEEREQVAEQIGFSEPIDFQSDLRPPREP